MFILPSNAKVFFYSKPISQQKGIDALTNVIQNEMGMEPCCGHYFMFCNSKRDRFKVLYKEGDNLAIWFKRFKGTLTFSYSNQIIVFDKKGFITFLEKTCSKDTHNLKKRLTF